MSLQNFLLSNSEILLKIFTNRNNPYLFFQYNVLSFFFFRQNLNLWKLSFKEKVNTLGIKRKKRRNKKGQQHDKYKITSMDPDARVYFNSKWLLGGDTYREKNLWTVSLLVVIFIISRVTILSESLLLCEMM